jgi:uncharacterized membrane protein YdfJ with MMPL/SSD domain
VPARPGGSATGGDASGWGWCVTNKLLLAGIAVALAFAAALVYLPALHGVFGTAALSPGQLATVAPLPLIVWGADEIRRMLVRNHARRPGDVHPG